MHLPFFFASSYNSVLHRFYSIPLIERVYSHNVSILLICTLQMNTICWRQGLYNQKNNAGIKKAVFSSPETVFTGVKRKSSTFVLLAYIVGKHCFASSVLYIVKDVIHVELMYGRFHLYVYITTNIDTTPSPCNSNSGRWMVVHHQISDKITSNNHGRRLQPSQQTDLPILNQFIIRK